MGKKSRNKKQRRLERERKKAERNKPRPYTYEERNKKITSILMQLMNMGMDHVLTPEFRQGLFDWRDNGTAFHAELDLPEYSRKLVASFDNDFSKDKDNALNFVFQRVRIQGEGDENKVNEINKIQEKLIL